MKHPALFKNRWFPRFFSYREALPHPTSRSGKKWDAIPVENLARTATPKAATATPALVIVSPQAEEDRAEHGRKPRSRMIVTRVQFSQISFLVSSENETKRKKCTLQSTSWEISPSSETKMGLFFTTRRTTSDTSPRIWTGLSTNQKSWATTQN